MIGDADVRGDAIHDREAQRLHRMEPSGLVIKAKGDQLIEPRHQQTGVLLAESDNQKNRSESQGGAGRQKAVRRERAAGVLGAVGAGSNERSGATS